MMFHGGITITVLIAAAIATFLPPERDRGVPPPNPLPDLAQTIPDFNVRHLKAQAVVTSRRNFISFHVRPYPQANPSHCHAIGTTLTHTLSPVPKTWCHPSHNHTTASFDDKDDHVWFAFTPDDDVDSSIAGGMQYHHSRSTGGAHLRIVRQVDEHTYDEAVQYFPGTALPMVGYGRLAHQVYRGPENLSVVAVRYGGNAH